MLRSQGVSQPRSGRRVACVRTPAVQDRGAYRPASAVTERTSAACRETYPGGARAGGRRYRRDTTRWTSLAGSTVAEAWMEPGSTCLERSAVWCPEWQTAHSPSSACSPCQTLAGTQTSRTRGTIIAALRPARIRREAPRPLSMIGPGYYSSRMEDGVRGQPSPVPLAGLDRFQPMSGRPAWRSVSSPHRAPNAHSWRPPDLSDPC